MVLHYIWGSNQIPIIDKLSVSLVPPLGIPWRILENRLMSIAEEH